MFEYSKLVFNQTVEDVKKLSRVASFASQGIYISYLIYTVATTEKLLIANIALLAISIAYLIFSIVMTAKEVKKTDGKIKKNAKQAYKIAKYVIQTPILITAIITLATEQSNNITFTLLFTMLMILGYVISILLSCITKIVEDRAKKFVVAIEADIEPVMGVINTVRKFMGEKVDLPESDKTKEKIRADLDVKVGERKREQEKKEPTEAEKAALAAVRKEIISDILTRGANSVKKKVKDKLVSIAAKVKKPKAISENTEEEKETIEK